MKKVVLIGSYTMPESTCIRRAVVDTEAGTIDEIEAVPNVGNPIYFAVNRDRTRLYVAENDPTAINRSVGGTLAVYSLDDNLYPTKLDSRTYDFSIPCHISLSNNEDKLVFAEYSGAHAGFICLKSDGTFVDGHGSIVLHEGHGPNEARQEKAHCHCAVASPDDKYLYICDLGTDTVNCYDLTQQVMTSIKDNDFHCEPGLGPRHMIFNREGTRCYVVYELESKVQPFAYENGKLKPLQAAVSMLPSDFTGETKAAAIRISPCGKWLLASNRGHNSIAAFKILADGSLDLVPTISPLTGAFPRDFNFVGETDCIILGHKMSDNVGLYRFCDKTGELVRLGGTLEMPKPLAFAQ